MMNKEKVIRTNKYYDTETGYLDDESGEFINHSFDDEPAIIYSDGAKYWYKDDSIHRDNHKPAVIYSNGNYEFYKNGKEYWIINNKEYYYMNTIKEKFKNNILYLPNVENTNILKENNIDAIWIDWDEYIILNQSQYILAVLKFI